MFPIVTWRRTIQIHWDRLLGTLTYESVCAYGCCAGGSINNDPTLLRATNRYWDVPDLHFVNIGFRLVSSRLRSPRARSKGLDSCRRLAKVQGFGPARFNGDPSSRRSS
jgi:hypothetical protein